MKTTLSKIFFLSVFIAYSLYANVVLASSRSIPIQVYVQQPNNTYEMDFGKTAPKTINNRLYIPLNALDYLANNVSYNSKTKEIAFTNDSGLQIQCALGSLKVQKGEQVFSLAAAPVSYNKTVYVPLKSTVELLGYEVVSDSKSHKITVSKVMMESKHFKFHITKKVLLKKSANGKDILIASKIEIPHPDVLSIEEKETSNGNFIVQLNNCYGEPHIHYGMLAYYVADNKLIDSDYVHYFNVSSPYLSTAHNLVALTNGKTIKVYDDITHALKETLNLDEFVTDVDSINKGYDPSSSYVIEGFGEGFLLIRGSTGILTLLYTDTKETVQLYKELLDPEEQVFAESNDIPRFGDYLEFKKQEGSKLYFENNSGFKDPKHTLYVYEMINH